MWSMGEALDEFLIGNPSLVLGGTVRCHDEGGAGGDADDVIESVLSTNEVKLGDVARRPSSWNGLGCN